MNWTSGCHQILGHKLLSTKLLSTASLDKAKSGFKKTEIFPFNQDVFNTEDFLPSAMTERELVDDSNDT